MKRVVIAAGSTFVVVLSLLFGALRFHMDSDAALVRRIASDGEHLEAHVAGRTTRVRPTPGRRPTERDTVYVIELEGTLSGGRAFAEPWEVSQAQYEGTADGSVVAIVVSPDDPHVWLTERALALRDEDGHAEGDWLQPLLFSAILSALAAIGAAVIALRFSRAQST
ncbi:MAG: hypothetical protein K1X94_16510 [Sandaracinaceae bacterium]|nr:hypothetical protein [Sandaracinaceae bacterium]